MVTGGAGGLGSAICAGFLREGAAVAVADVDHESCEQVAAKFGVSSDQVCVVTCDVRDPAGVLEAVELIEQSFGRLDVLVNGAGGSLRTPRDLSRIREADFDLVVDVNLKGTFLCCQAAAPALARAGGGAIVNVSSIGGRSASPVTGAAYAAAKAGVLGLTRKLARELGSDGTRVNAVAPGFFPSGPRLQELWDTMPVHDQEEVLAAIPLGRVPSIGELVGPVLFLASTDASYVTGAVLDVNGGRFMS